MKSDEIISNIPRSCSSCGNDLEERTGNYGKFLGIQNIDPYLI